METATTRKGYFSPTRIAVIAMFSALAGVLYIFNFSMPYAFPSFLEFNFSDVPALIGTFALGPTAGAIIVLCKILIKLVFKMTSTAFVGDFADLIIGIALVVPAGLIYKKRRTFKGALVGMAVGTASSVAVAILANWLVLVPFYVSFFFHGSWDPLIGMMGALFPACTVENFYNYYLWVSVLPFNVMRCLVAIIITLPIYKHISTVINRVNDKVTPKHGDQTKIRRVNIGAIIIGVAVVLVLVAVILIRNFLTG